MMQDTQQGALIQDSALTNSYLQRIRALEELVKSLQQQIIALSDRITALGG